TGCDRDWSSDVCSSDLNDLVVLDDSGAERERFSFPRQRHDRHLCLADFFRPAGSGEPDVAGFQLVTVGTKLSQATGELFAKDASSEERRVGKRWGGRLR